MLCQDKLWQLSLYNTVVSPGIIVHWFANGIYDWLPLVTVTCACVLQQVPFFQRFGIALSTG